MIERWQYQPEAREEVVEAARYYEEQQSGLGDEFLEAFERMLLDADAAPEHALSSPPRTALRSLPTLRRSVTGTAGPRCASAPRATHGTQGGTGGAEPGSEQAARAARCTPSPRPP